MLVDPHTAVGLSVARKFVSQNNQRVILATAHPAKFPDAVFQATGVSPELPHHLSDLFDRKEKFITLANDLSSVQAYVNDNIKSSQ